MVPETRDFVHNDPREEENGCVKAETVRCFEIIKSGSLAGRVTQRVPRASGFNDVEANARVSIHGLHATTSKLTRARRGSRV